MKRIISIAFLMSALIISGCDKGFEELNVNPNLPSETNPDFLFARAQQLYFTQYEHGVFTEVWGLNIWTQQMADINGIGGTGSEYLLAGDALNTSWRLMYADVLGNLKEAKRLAESDASLSNHRAIYSIFSAYIMQRITDLWGDVPYSEALQASSDALSPNFTPAYNSQREIYTGLFAELKAAEALLDPTKSSPGNQDWIYGGDVNLWKKFSRTLRLRMALRLGKVDFIWAQEEGEAALETNDLISSFLESAQFPHADFARSPFYQLDFTGQGMRNPSKFMIDLFKSTEDPRLSFYAEPSPESIIIFGQPEYFGVPNFLVASEIDPEILNDFTVSAVGNYFLEVNRPGIILSYSESCFLQAEAAMRGWGGGSAKFWHDMGVRAHMDFLGLHGDVMTLYLNGHGKFDGKLEKIITEKWKTFVYVNAIEAFNEYRRTGYPVLLNPDGTELDESRVPKKLAYPNSEISLNSSNVSAVGIDPQDYFAPVWWDVD